MSLEKYDIDNTASLRLIANGIQRIAEALECQGTATATPSSTNEDTESSATATETSWPHYSTKPAKHIANIADYVSSRNPPPRTKTETSAAWTAPHWSELYWVEQVQGNTRQGAWLSTHGPTYLVNLADNWTLREALEAAWDEEQEQERINKFNG